MSVGPFASFLQSLRRQQQLPLRRFCEQFGLDPGTYSKMERGLRPPPKSRQAQDKLAHQLGLEEGSEARRAFLDAVAISAGQVPQDILDDEAMAAKLPVLFRTIRGEKLAGEQLDGVVELMGNTGRENELEHTLQKEGLIQEIKPPITDFTSYQNRTPIKLKGDGKTASETIVEERR